METKDATPAVKQVTSAQGISWTQLRPRAFSAFKMAERAKKFLDKAADIRDGSKYALLHNEFKFEGTLSGLTYRVFMI